MIFKCTKGVGIGDYSCGGGGGRGRGEFEKNRGAVIISMQLAFTERVVPAMQAFDRSLGLVYVADTDKSLTSRRFYKTHAVIP